MVGVMYAWVPPCPTVGQEVIETKPVYKVFPLMEGEIEK
jgi:hypothetical protein